MKTIILQTIILEAEKSNSNLILVSLGLLTYV